MKEIIKTNLPTLEDDIKKYLVQDLNQYDPELLQDKNENKEFCICSRQLLMDLRSTRELLETMINKSRDQMDKVALLKMILEKM